MFIALAIASLFAWLGQWQLGRAVESNQKIQVVKTETINVMLDTKNVFIVKDRIQNGAAGFWVIANSHKENGESEILALGWTPDLSIAEAVRNELKASMVAQSFLPVAGSTLPPEPVTQSDSDYLLGSISTAQLANLVGESTNMSYDYLAVDQKHVPMGLQKIQASISETAGINWLSAFYAVEWTVFALLAVFMWWRLLKDALVLRALK